MKLNKMMRRKRLQKQKKLKNKYIFISDEENILGESHNICNTIRNLWRYYKCDSRRIYINLDPKIKVHKIREKCLSLEEYKGKQIYKYHNKIITSNEFVLLLECDKQRETEDNSKY